MTAAQTKARARFKAAVKEAAKLRAKDPKLSQAEAVKKAWAILYGKKVGATPKKTAAKKTAKRKSPETHTDTKSHNVNIRVVSGTPVKTAVKKALRAAGKRLKHGYATVPGTVRKLSGQNDSLVENAIKKRNETEKNLLEVRGWINEIEKNMKSYAPYEKGHKRGALDIYKKWANKYKSDLIFLNRIISVTKRKV
jgi:hypothetical protein